MRSGATTNRVPRRAGRARRARSRGAAASAARDARAEDEAGGIAREGVGAKRTREGDGEAGGDGHEEERIRRRARCDGRTEHARAISSSRRPGRRIGGAEALERRGTLGTRGLARGPAARHGSGRDRDAHSRSRRGAAGGAAPRRAREAPRGRRRPRPEGARSGTPGVGTLARPAAFAGDSPWFKLGAWRRLLDALDLEAFDPASPLLRTNVAWILNGGWRGQRVHRLAVVVQDAFETAFGDLKVVLADPTGSIRCTVHRDVAAADPRAFRKGGALLLQNVPVLTLAEFTEHYLVVAENELVRRSSRTTSRAEPEPSRAERSGDANEAANEAGRDAPRSTRFRHLARRKRRTVSYPSRRPARVRIGSRRRRRRRRRAGRPGGGAASRAPPRARGARRRRAPSGRERVRPRRRRGAQERNARR